LHAAGAHLIVGLTSAGRIAPGLPLPCLVVATSAIRDEGTSYHYLQPASEVDCPSPVEPHFTRELISTGWEIRSGCVWTTDAPYRESEEECPASTTPPGQRQLFLPTGCLTKKCYRTVDVAVGEAFPASVVCMRFPLDYL
jgi:uridine phosphorylase